MGEAKLREAKDQPISGDALKALYPEILEIELAGAKLRLQQVELQHAAVAFNAKVEAYGISLNEWRIDYKAGKMTRLVPVAEPAE